MGEFEAGVAEFTLQ